MTRYFTNRDTADSPVGVHLSFALGLSNEVAPLQFPGRTHFKENRRVRRYDHGSLCSRPSRIHQTIRAVQTVGKRARGASIRAVASCCLEVPAHSRIAALTARQPLDDAPRIVVQHDVDPRGHVALLQHVSVECVTFTHCHAAANPEPRGDDYADPIREGQDDAPVLLAADPNLFIRITPCLAFRSFLDPLERTQVGTCYLPSWIVVISSRKLDVGGLDIP